MKFNRSGRVIRATAILFVLTLISCTTDELEINFEDFVVSFDHVKSDTGINNVGAEELIWLDESRFLSFSVVIDRSGKSLLGLHLISISGDALAIVEGVISDFCVLGNNILIQGHQGFPTIVGTAPGYNIELVSKNQLLKIEEKEYSALRCGLVSLPEKQPAIFRPLRPEDGFLEITVEDERAWNSLNSAGQRSLFSNSEMTKQDFLRKKFGSFIGKANQNQFGTYTYMGLALTRAIKLAVDGQPLLTLVTKNFPNPISVIKTTEDYFRSGI